MKIESEIENALRVMKQFDKLEPGDPGRASVLAILRGILPSVILELFKRKLVSISYIAGEITNQEFKITFKGECVLAMLKGKKEDEKICIRRNGFADTNVQND